MTTAETLEELRRIQKECQECAESHIKRPGLLGNVNAGVIADLYLTIDRLARIVERTQRELKS